MKGVKKNRRIKNASPPAKRRAAKGTARRASVNGAGSRAPSRARKTGKATHHQAAKASKQRNAPRRNAREKKLSNAAYDAEVKNFENGARYLQKQNFEKAKECFQKVLEGPAGEITDRARVYLRVCEQKLERQEAKPRTAQEFYVLAVTQLNARELESALGNLQKANQMEPGRAHIRYAIAAVHALQGNSDAALDHLKAAIELEPRNRIQARRDDDLQGLAEDSRFKRLISAESFTSSGTTSGITS